MAWKVHSLCVNLSQVLHIFVIFPQIITGNVKVVIYAGRGGRGVKFQVHTINGWR